MKETAVWLLALATTLVLGTVVIGALAGLTWRVASWVAG